MQKNLRRTVRQRHFLWLLHHKSHLIAHQSKYFNVMLKKERNVRFALGVKANNQAVIKV